MKIKNEIKVEQKYNRSYAMKMRDCWESPGSYIFIVSLSLLEPVGIFADLESIVCYNITVYMCLWCNCFKRTVPELIVIFSTVIEF